MVGPLGLKTQELDVGLSASLVLDVLGDEEAGGGEIDSAEAFSSSGLEDPVVGVKSA
jgi:hypothetical protein